MTMKRMLPLLIVLLTVVLLPTVWGQANYATPYAFTTIAGTNGVPGSLNGTNNGALLYWPEGVAVDSQGNLYVSDNFENTIRKITPVGTNWVVTTIAGTAGTAGPNDGSNAAARFNEPTGIALDPSGNLYVADYNNNAIRKITPSGPNWVVSTITIANAGTPGFINFKGPSGVAVDAQGNLYIADTQNNTIREAVPQGTNWVVTTIAGTAGGYGGSADGTNGAAQFDQPSAIALDSAGNLYVADTDNFTIRKLTPVGTNWVVTTIAGQAGNYGSADGLNTAAQFFYSSGIAVDGSGNVFVADTDNYTVRMISPVGTNWMVSTIAGQPGNYGSTDGTGANALFSSPYGIAVDAGDNVYVGDPANYTLRLGRSTATAAPPNLAITLTAPSTVTVAWPAGGSYSLQTNADLSTTNWGVYGGSFTAAGGTNSISLPAPAGNLFFRLSK
jgi:sugar lactone lactonase YvrE